MLQQTMEKQVGHTFHALRTAIENCPDELWSAGEGAYLVIARLAFHALQAVDYHLDAHPERFDWEGSDIEALWDWTRTLAYLDEMHDKARACVADEAGLLGEDVSPRFHLSRLDHLCYALPHMVQHTGEINALLRQAGAPVGGWL